MQLKEAEYQQHINVTGKSLFKGFSTKSVRNYDQKLSFKLDIGVAWNSSRCGMFLTFLNALWQLQKYQRGFKLRVWECQMPNSSFADISM